VGVAGGERSVDWRRWWIMRLFVITLLEKGEGRNGGRWERRHPCRPSPGWGHLAGKDAGAPSGLYGQIVTLVNGGSALTWALEFDGVGEAESGGKSNGLLESVPAGCDGVGFLAFHGAGGRGRGVAPTTKGYLSGLQLSHKPAHVARAVVEGLAFELKLAPAIPGAWRRSGRETGYGRWDGGEPGDDADYRGCLLDCRWLCFSARGPGVRWERRL